MLQDLVDKRECGGWFHVAVTAMLDLLSKAVVVVLSRREKEKRKKRREMAF